MPNVACICLANMTTVTPPASAVLCLGNFDGVHVAHQALIQRAKQLRDSNAPQAVCGVFCFHEPSWCFLSNDPPQKLCTLSQKLEAFRVAGAEYVYLADFPAMSHLSPDRFLQTVLKDLCHAVGVVCGFNYRFGAKGVGAPDDLIGFFGNNVIIEEPINLGGTVVSSSRIRALLKDGKIKEANLLLGRPYAFSATVVHGKALGKKLGAPTLNQYFPTDVLIPRHGVYVSKCKVAGVTYRGVSNVGSHPTVDQNAAVNCETYLIGFQGDLYGAELTIEFLHFLREEKCFSSPEELSKQIQADVQAARDWNETEATL